MRNAACDMQQSLSLVSDQIIVSVRRIAPSQKIDMLKFLLLLFSCTILITCTDASYMYHSIRVFVLLILSV